MQENNIVPGVYTRPDDITLTSFIQCRQVIFYSDYTVAYSAYSFSKGWRVGGGRVGKG